MSLSMPPSNAAFHTIDALGKGESLGFPQVSSGLLEPSLVFSMVRDSCYGFLSRVPPLLSPRSHCALPGAEHEVVYLLRVYVVACGSRYASPTTIKGSRELLAATILVRSQ